MKKLLFILVILTFTLNGLFAQAISSKTEKINGAYIENLPEKPDVINAYEKDKDTILKGAENFTGKKDIKFDLKNSFKLYFMKAGDVFNEYNSGKKFNELISKNANDCFYALPVTKDGNNISVVFLKKFDKVDEKQLKDKGLSDETIKMCKDQEGKIGVAEIHQVLENDGYDILANPSKVEEILEKNNIEDISEIKFVTQPHLNLIYVNTKDGEYGIPFAARPDLVNVKNGSVYKMDELINLYKIINNSSNLDPNMAFGGSLNSQNVTQNQDNGSYNTIYFIAFPLILTISLILYMLRKKKQKSFN